MSFLADVRIAWVFPSLGENKRQGYPWHSVLSKFTQRFLQTKIFTARWPGFAEGFEDSFTVEVVGDLKFVETKSNPNGYGAGFTFLSPNIVRYLLSFQPQVIFVCAFSLWTLLVLLLKPVIKSRVIIVYEGSSPGVDYRGSKLRLALRRWMVRAADAFITNNQAGKNYLVEVLNASPDEVFARPYEIATPELLLRAMPQTDSLQLNLKKPVFIAVGQLIPRKGIHLLLQACAILREQGYQNYTVLIAGDGPQRQELETLSQEYHLQDCIHWAGWVDYSELGAYFQNADVFIFPTLEDTWGMVTLEAMALGKPVLCSKWAGTAEMVVDGVNGYVFDPHEPEKMAEAMGRFINNIDLIKVMGEKSQEMMAPYTPETVCEFFTEVVNFVLDKEKNEPISSKFLS
jgi:glycosyltransferase involved in cell wall biosynthesis